MSDDPLWYKDAIIYEVHVRAFHDKDGDGYGDFTGLREKVDYLADLGVTTIWLLPFTASPLKDDGYDIADYTTVHPRYGTIDDFRQFLDEAHARGMRVITELVINHTSDQHPWFQRARHSPAGSPERDFYVWSDNPEKYAGVPLMFPDFETSNWAWDPVAKQYYWHRFYSHQPDLNFDNPAVRASILPIIDFWFGMGVDGLRLDAVPYLFEREGTSCEHLPETHAFLKQMRKHADENHPHRMFLAEANAWPEDMVSYFGTGDECQMAFHFPLMPRLFMALHQEDRFPILDILEQTPVLPENCQWCLFLRNHDELTLAMVTDEERDSLYSAYTQDRQARLFQGIRHRLAPLLRNDRRRIELMNALLFSLPGTPVIYYGDEIGMGDNIYLGDRNGVRTPMQWSADRNAGFSRANSQKLYLPIIIDSEYHYEAINVDAQQSNSSSLLWWMKRLIALRKQHPAFGRGTIEFLRPENSKVLAFVRRHDDQCLLIVANLSRFVQPFQLDLSSFAGLVPEELFGRTRFPLIGETPYPLTLGPHGFYWFALTPVPNALRSDSITVLPTADWRELVQGRGRQALARFLQVRSPVDRGETVDCRVVESIPVPIPTVDVRLLTAKIETSSDASEPVFQPLARIPVSQLAVDENVLAQATVARTADPAATVFCDPLMLPAYRAALIELVRTGGRLSLTNGIELAGYPLAGLTEVSTLIAHDSPMTPVIDEFQQLSAIIGQQLLIHVFRRADEGFNPDVEIGRYLTEQAHFEGFLPVVGFIDHRRNGAEPSTLVALHRCGPDQNSAWQWMLDQTSRFFETVAAKSPDVSVEALQSPGVGFVFGPNSADWEQWIGAYIDSARVLGTFTGRLHAALAQTSQPAIAPIPVTSLYLRSWYQTFRNHSARLLKLLSAAQHELPEPVRELAQHVLGRQASLYKCLRLAMDSSLAAGRRIRCHGDFHLGKLLVSGRTVLLPSFEGDVSRPLSERRIKHSPLRDVASLIRSLDYVGGVIRLDLLDAPGQTPLIVRSRDSATLEPFAAAWYDRLGYECWNAYCETAGVGELLPDSASARNLALSMELLDRTLREAYHDISLRSNRALISLSALLRLLNQLENAT